MRRKRQSTVSRSSLVDGVAQRVDQIDGHGRRVWGQAQGWCDPVIDPSGGGCVSAAAVSLMMTLSLHLLDHAFAPPSQPWCGGRRCPCAHDLVVLCTQRGIDIAQRQHLAGSLLAPGAGLDQFGAQLRQARLQTGFLQQLLGLALGSASARPRQSRRAPAWPRRARPAIALRAHAQAAIRRLHAARTVSALANRGRLDARSAAVRNTRGTKKEPRVLAQTFLKRNNSIPILNFHTGCKHFHISAIS